MVEIQYLFTVATFQNTNTPLTDPKSEVCGSGRHLWFAPYSVWQAHHLQPDPWDCHIPIYLPRMFCSVPLLTDWNVPYELARKVTKLDSTRAVQWETYPSPDGFALEVNILTDSEYLCCSQSRVRHVCSAVSYRTHFRGTSFTSVLWRVPTRKSYDSYDGIVACSRFCNIDYEAYSGAY